MYGVEKPLVKLSFTDKRKKMFLFAFHFLGFSYVFERISFCHLNWKQSVFEKWLDILS